MFISLTGVVVAKGQRYEGEMCPGDRPARPDECGPDVAAISAALESAVQAHLDAGARALGYDNISTAVSYADEPAVLRYQAEGKTMRAWRSRVWAHCNDVLAKVLAGQRAVPAIKELLAELPVP